MATYSTVAIVNRALLLCGASPITALTDDTVNARAANATYEISRKQFLTEGRFSFSLTRSTLATVATTTFAFLYDEEGYGYSVPSNVLRIWDVSDPYASWRVEGGYIISDTGDLGAIYAFDQDDLSKWTPAAIEAFIDKLCADVSFNILNDAKKAMAFLEKYEKISLPRAEAQNAQTGKHQFVIDDEWVRSKWANGTQGDPSRSYS